MCLKLELQAQNGAWIAIPRTFLLLAYLDTCDNLPDYAVALQGINEISNITKSGLWTHFDLSAGNTTFQASIYRKRLIIYRILGKDPKDLKKTISEGLDFTSEARIIANTISSKLCGKCLSAIRTYSLIDCGDIKKPFFPAKKTSKHLSWIDDGLSTFYVRVYDSKRIKLGLVRVSRHLCVTYGLSEDMLQDLCNIIYEEFLYKDTEVDANMVFKLFDALGDYVLPMELNLYIQKIFYALAIFAALFAVSQNLTNDLFSLAAASPNAQPPYVMLFRGQEYEIGLAALAWLKALLSITFVIFLWAIVRQMVAKIVFR